MSPLWKMNDLQILALHATPLFHLCEDPSQPTPEPNLKPILTPKQAFELVNTSQNAPTSQKCPHFASRMDISVLRYVQKHTHTHTRWALASMDTKLCSAQADCKPRPCLHVRRPSGRSGARRGALIGLYSAPLCASGAPRC